MSFEFKKLPLKDAFCITYFYSGDSRGCFAKNFEENIYLNEGIKFHVTESFYSVSQKGVLRGLHFQTNDPQAKLVSVLNGKVWDVIVDIRPESPTFKQWIGVELSAENHKALFVPRGFAHGFMALEDKSIMLYQCDGAYSKDTDAGIIYNDLDIDIKWPYIRIGGEENTIISSRDQGLKTFDLYFKNNK